MENKMRRAAGVMGRGRGIMLELFEAEPLPAMCQECERKQAEYWAADDERKLEIEQQGFYFDCGSCECGGERFLVSRKDELQLKRKMAERAIIRLLDQIAAIDEELASME